jgi:MinD-like ATPase involved in chromosome partitioning or flagellar assembly
LSDDVDILHIKFVVSFTYIVIVDSPRLTPFLDAVSFLPVLSMKNKNEKMVNNGRATEKSNLDGIRQLAGLSKQQYGGAGAGHSARSSSSAGAAPRRSASGQKLRRAVRD